MKHKRTSFSSYIKLSILGLIVPILLFSCINQRNLEYMRISEVKPPVYNETGNLEYKLQAGDALYIQISSIDDAASNVFAQNSTIMTMDPYAAYMQSFVIDENGFLQLPVIGEIFVSGKTLEEVSDMIKEAVTNILSLPAVTVKLVNQYVSVLGEVTAPGHYVFSQDKFTIYNALGLAGDITVYGDRKEVILIRNENGKNHRITVDLTREDILGSPYYFIQPNDFIYVKPLPKRVWGMETFPYGMVLTLISTIMLMYTIIQQQQ